MRIAISNIAWDISEDEQVAALLSKYEVDAIDVAPTKYFSNPKDVSSVEIDRVRDWWKSHGIDITGMQSLLFGTSGLNLFDSSDKQTGMLSHLEAVCRIGAELGATKLVFGSPKNRDCSALSSQATHDIAVHFFKRLAKKASQYGVVICLEPNPPCYGANFMTNSDDTAAIVGAVGHASIRMQLDTGALAINNEDSAQTIEKYADLIGHVHASEPELITLGDGSADHAGVSLKLRELLPEQVVTIEMLPAKNEPNIDAIERAIGVAILYYRCEKGATI